MAKKPARFDAFAWLDKAVSDDLYRPVLCAVHRDAANPNTFVATNTHILFAVTLDDQDCPLEETWAPGTNKVLNAKLQKKVLDKDVYNFAYPNWSRVIPFALDGKVKDDGYSKTDMFVEITCNVAELVQVLNYMRPVCKDVANRLRIAPIQNKNGGWDIEFKAAYESKHGIEVTTLCKNMATVQLTNGDRVETTFDLTNRLPIAFNCEYLLDALNGANLFPDGEVTMRFYAASRAMQMNFSRIPNITAVIMPMSLY
jgi:hypothetical protein